MSNKPKPALNIDWDEWPDIAHSVEMMCDGRGVLRAKNGDVICHISEKVMEQMNPDGIDWRESETLKADGAKKSPGMYDPPEHCKFCNGHCYSYDAGHWVCDHCDAKYPGAEKVTPGKDIRFGWINPSGHESRAEPYGVRIDTETGMFAETENHFSKLTPFLEQGGQWVPITSEEGAETALLYVRQQEQYSPAQKKEIEDRLHRGTELEEFVRCSQCHSENGIMDFARLGFQPARINQLQKMEIGGMLTNYDTFYFPEFFERKFK